MSHSSRSMVAGSVIEVLTSGPPIVRRCGREEAFRLAGDQDIAAVHVAVVRGARVRQHPLSHRHRHGVHRAGEMGDA